MQAKGFQVWQTGGDCTAYGKTYDNGNYTMVTDEGGAGLPVRGSILIGSYDADGEQLEVTSCSTQGELDEAVIRHKTKFADCVSFNEFREGRFFATDLSGFANHRDLVDIPGWVYCDDAFVISICEPNAFLVTEGNASRIFYDLTEAERALWRYIITCL